jgi:mannose/cellobiose epimerase-like protein (N-acyl-D-glucosamine 2-epimerase family)
MNDSAGAPRSIAQLETWLVESAWPLWRDHGVDHRCGGFHEALDPTTLSYSAPFRRLRVLTRQIYVFSCAAQHGLPGAEALVAFGLDILRRARQPDGGYAWRFALNGSAIDQRRDLYDHAFVLFALASAASVAADPRIRTEALRLMAWLDTTMRHPAGGYREASPDVDEPRRQNAHMHLLEATLAAWDAFGDELFLDRADELVGLFLTRFYDSRTGALPEFFSETLSALPHAQGNRIEPGHHAEWIGLLDWQRRSSLAAGRSVPPGSEDAAIALWIFAERFGVHSGHGAFIDGLGADGGVQAAGARLWPQTERLKAAVLNLTDPQGLDRAVAALAPYLDHPVQGLWHERRTPEGPFAVEPVPASSLYHLTSGILFARRFARESELNQKRPGLPPAFDLVVSSNLSRDARSPTSWPQPCRSPAKP